MQGGSLREATVGDSPAPLHRLALRLAHGLRLVWWRLTRHDLHGCNAIVSNAEGAVLLVRHSYQARDRWMRRKRFDLV